MPQIGQLPGSIIDARETAARRLADVEARIADLHAMRKVLGQLIRDCGHHEGRMPCPIVAALVAPADGHAVTSSPRSS
jgi:hypothetical protein